jgi:hypothetical protein
MGHIKECVEKNGKILDEFEAVWQSFDDHIIEKERELKAQKEEAEGIGNLEMKEKIKKTQTKKLGKKK